MRHGILVLQSLLLALLLTWPAVTDLNGAALGTLDGDGIKHVWNLWWMRREFWEGTAGLTTTWVGFPDGMDLYPIEPLNGVIAALVPLPPVALSNVLAIVNLTLIGICAGWLGEIVSFRVAGAWVAGALAECSAFVAFTLQVGVGELREVWWIPLGLACLMEAQESGKRKWFVALGATLVGATLSCFYLGFFLALGVLVHALYTLRRHQRLLPAYVVTAAVSALLVAAPFSYFARTYDPDDGRDALTFSEWQTSRPLETYPAAAAAPEQWVEWRSRDRAATDRQSQAYTGGRYLGILTLALAAWGAWLQPRRALPFIAIAAVGMLFSLGTVLWHQGEIVTMGGRRLILPLAWINAVLGYYAEPINFPSRFLALPAIALAVAAAPIARWRWSLVLTGLACLDMLLHDLVPWPRTVFALPNVEGLRAPPGEGGVLNVTPFVKPNGWGPQGILAGKDPEARSRAIATQLQIDRRFDIIPIERMDFWSPDGLMWAVPLPMMAALRTPTTSFDSRRDLWLLRDRGFELLLLTHVGSGMEAQIAMLTQLCGVPAHGGVATLWSVPDVEAAEAEGALWRAAHEKDVAALPPLTMGAQQ